MGRQSSKQAMAAIVPFLIPAGVGLYKLYHNSLPDEKLANSHAVRQQGIIERQDGRLAQLSDKQFENLVRRNSVFRDNEQQLREARDSKLGRSSTSSTQSCASVSSGTVM